MNEHRDRRVQADEDALLRRWYAVFVRVATDPLGRIARRGRTRSPRRRPFRNLAMAAVAIVAILAGIRGAGLGELPRRRRPSNSPGATSLASITPRRSPRIRLLAVSKPSVPGSFGPALAGP